MSDESPRSGKFCGQHRRFPYKKIISHCRDSILAVRTLIGCLIIFSIVSACTSPSASSSISITPTPQPRTTWGDIINLGQAPYAPAPSVLSRDGDILTGWIGADDERVFQGFRYWHDDTLDSTVIPVLDVSAPFAQSIFPADNDGYHLLWMDIEPQAERIQLFSAYLDNTLTTLIAPPSFASEQVTHYTAIPDIEGALWVVWSGGLLAEPALYYVRIDGLGRPMFPERLRLDGDYPVFAQTLDNRTYLFWISQVNRAVLRGEFVGGELQDVRAISQLPDLSGSDRLIEFSAMFDRTHQYLFWNIMREDGKADTYISTSPINSEDVISPQPMTITVDTTQTIQTGFNSSTVYTAVSVGDTRLSWASPLDESADVLPVVVQNEVSIGVTYWQGGAIIGYQTLTETGQLLRSPHITTDRDRHLTVTWSQPTAYGVANLNMTTTR